MGNQNSRSTTPTSSPQSPVGSAGASQSHGHDRTLHPHAPSPLHPAQARRRESIHTLSTAKAHPAPPTLTTTTAPASTSNNTTAKDGTMGNEQSTSKASTPPDAQPPQHPLPPPPSPPPPAETPPQAVQPSPSTQPVDVPTAHHDDPAASISSLDPATSSQDYLVPSSHFSRPPRLPLPIEEEVHTPGSPIISPNDLASPIDHGEIEGALPRRTSMLSSTTVDDDDLGEEFKTPTGRLTVPTLIEWEGPGERVYVTGTFAGWNRKYRLSRGGPSENKDALSAIVHIHPGTHHLMFIVDNDMMISDKLPTAVDYTNILVNYLEVSYDDVLDPAADQSAKTDAVTPVQERPAPDGVFPPQTLPPSPTPAPVKPPAPDVPDTSIPEPTKKYHQNIPKYLLDLDAPEESSRFARANAAAANLPTPPSLPMFLSKSILNGTTPMKDDSSVLIMPNHTVLNHLATSSIKDNILATSATTRYKQKFLTTIMYKPKEESEDRVH